jgi:hypothetical protein
MTIMMNKICCKDLREWQHSLTPEQNNVFEQAFHVIFSYGIDGVHTPEHDALMQPVIAHLAENGFMPNADGTLHYADGWEPGRTYAKQAMALLDQSDSPAAKQIYVNVYVGCLKAFRGSTCSN